MAVICNSILFALIILFFIIYSFYDTNCTIALIIVKILHFLFVIFILFGPFIFKTKLELQFYILISVFTMMHWILANDICALTLLEQMITGRCSDETFVGKIVKPVYNITNKEITILTIFLLIIAFYKYIKLYK